MERAMEEVWGIPNALEGFSFAGATDGGVAERVAPGRDREKMWRRYLHHLDRQLARRDDLAPLPGVVALLDRLRDTGARMGILTGNLRAGAQAKLAAVGLREYFEFSISAFAEDGIDRRMIAEAARARCGRGALTIVGDTVADRTCAAHVGARVLCVATGFQSRAELAPSAPDLLADDLSETDRICAWLLQAP